MPVPAATPLTPPPPKAEAVTVTSAATPPTPQSQHFYPLLLFHPPLAPTMFTTFPVLPSFAFVKLRAQCTQGHPPEGSFAGVCTHIPLQKVLL